MNRPLTFAACWVAALIACPPLQSADGPIPLSKTDVFAGTGKSSKVESAYASGQPSGVATDMKLGNPFGVEILGETVWLTTVDDHCIWRTTLSGKQVERVAGNGLKGYSGDGGPADQATFNWPHEVRADDKGNLYVADTRNHVIRRIDHRTGIVSTIAGNGRPGFAGDGKSGTDVQFKQPHSVVLDQRGGLLVADTQNHRLRRIDLTTGVVETICGTGERRMPTDGAVAKGTSLFGPRSLAVDQDSIWIALREGNCILRLDRAKGTIHFIAGTGEKGYSGDGGPPKQATFNGPKGLVMDDQRRLLVVDTENQAIRRIDLKTRQIETVMGGTKADSTFRLKRPHGISHHPKLGFVVADSENHRVLTGR